MPMLLWVVVTEHRWWPRAGRAAITSLVSDSTAGGLDPVGALPKVSLGPSRQRLGGISCAFRGTSLPVIALDEWAAPTWLAAAPPVPRRVTARVTTMRRSRSNQSGRPDSNRGPLDPKSS